MGNDKQQQKQPNIANTAATPKPRRWEYRTERMEVGDNDALTASLRALGAEGWELVAVVPYIVWHLAYFKKAVQS